MVLKFSFFFLESMVIEFMLSGFDVFHHPFAYHSLYYLYLMCFVDSEIETNT